MKLQIGFSIINVSFLKVFSAEIHTLERNVLPTPGVAPGNKIFIEVFETSI